MSRTHIPFSAYSLRSVPFAIWLWSRRELGVHGVVREAALAGGDVDTHAAMACALLGASGAALPSAELDAIADWPLGVERMREIARGASLAAAPLVAGWALRSVPMMAAVLAHGFRRALPY